MESHSQDLELIHARLLKLETQNRRFKQVGAAVLIVAAALLVMGQAAPRKIVEASEFIVKDSAGKIRASLAMDEKAKTPRFTLFDASGALSDEKNTRVMLDDNGISLWDPQGHVTASLRGGVLMLGGEGESGLTLLIPGHPERGGRGRVLRCVGKDYGFNASDR